MPLRSRKYKTQDITVSYQPRRCTHVGECLRRAPKVFNTWEQPWVQLENGAVEEIVDAVERCPTGALHYERTDGGAQEQPRSTSVVFVARNGPYYVRGDLEIVLPDGSVMPETRAALCRCGASQTKPFCDNTHRELGFRDAGLHQAEGNAQNDLPPNQKLRITPQPNGNLKFEGAFEMRDAMGQVIARGEREGLCRCGASNDKPFCDSSHKRIGFKTGVSGQESVGSSQWSGENKMSEQSDKLVVVGGATGQQGGAVARHLLKQGWKVRALTRDLNKDAAKALAAQGAEIFQNDLDDRAGLDEALQGAYGAFSVQNFWLPNVGYDGEIRQGKIFADAAKAAGVKHFVYSSVGAAHRGMGQKHFDSKWEIEKYIQSLDLPYTILRPVAFMENAYFTQAAISNGMYFDIGVRPDKKTQVIATDDIGAFAALVLAKPQEFMGKTIELAGDELTASETAATLAQVIGRPVNLMPAQPQTNPEMIAMVNFFSGEAYTADIAALRKIYPEMKTYEQWLRMAGWENLPVMEMPKQGGSWG